MENAQILELLKDDKNYYGELGRNYLSNSDIGTLLNNPKMFGKKSEPSLAMLQGSYFHSMYLEPHKAKGFILVAISAAIVTWFFKISCKIQFRYYICRHYYSVFIVLVLSKTVSEMMRFLAIPLFGNTARRVTVGQVMV